MAIEGLHRENPALAQQDPVIAGAIGRASSERLERTAAAPGRAPTTGG